MSTYSTYTSRRPTESTPPASSDKLKVEKLQELFSTWSNEGTPAIYFSSSALLTLCPPDLQSVLTETAGDVELAVARISEGIWSIQLVACHSYPLPFLTKVTPSNGVLSIERRTKRSPNLLIPFLSPPEGIVRDLLVNLEADVVGVRDAAEAGEVEAAHVEHTYLARSVRLAHPLRRQTVLPPPLPPLLPLPIRTRAPMSLQARSFQPRRAT